MLNVLCVIRGSKFCYIWASAIFCTLLHDFKMAIIVSIKSSSEVRRGVFLPNIFLFHQETNLVHDGGGKAWV